jgi:hypothetical protein
MAIAMRARHCGNAFQTVKLGWNILPLGMTCSDKAGIPDISKVSASSD